MSGIERQSDALELDRALRRITELEAGIKTVLTQTGDDICWRDIYTELAALVGLCFNPDMLPRDVMLANCQRFVDSLLSGDEYLTVQEDESKIRARSLLWQSIARLTTISGTDYDVRMADANNFTRQALRELGDGNPYAPVYGGEAQRKRLVRNPQREVDSARCK